MKTLPEKDQTAMTRPEVPAVYADCLQWTMHEFHRICELNGYPGGGGSEKTRHQWTVEAARSLRKLAKKYKVTDA